MKSKTILTALVLIAGALAAQGAAAKTCAVEINSSDAMRYDKSEIDVAASCTEVKLTLHHTGKLAANIMGHNWVLAKTTDIAGITSDGIKAGAANDYVAPGDARVIAHTKLIGGGQSTTIQFPTKLLSRNGDYSFFCSFPGHSGMMHGKLIFH